MWSLVSIAQTRRLSRSRCLEHVSACRVRHTILSALQKRFQSRNELRRGSQHAAPLKIEIPAVGRKSSDERGEQTKVSPSSPGPNSWLRRARGRATAERASARSTFIAVPMPGSRRARNCGATGRETGNRGCGHCKLVAGGRWVALSSRRGSRLRPRPCGSSGAGCPGTP